MTDATPGPPPGAPRYQGQHIAGPAHPRNKHAKIHNDAPARNHGSNFTQVADPKAGADLAALQSATGWQPHSVRAALSGFRKAGYTIDRTEAAKSGGTAIYRITGGPDGAR